MFPLAKAHRLPYSNSQTRYTRPLQLLCADVWGPIPHVSRLGFKYYVYFLDHYIRYTWLFPLKLKSNVGLIFANFLPYVERFFNAKLIKLQTNGGGKFKSLTPICTKLGITHQFSCPHNH